MPDASPGHLPRLSAEFTVGSVRVAVLSDGAPEIAMGGFFHGAEAAEWMQALGITDPDERLPFNFGSFLIRDGQRTILVDSGWGPGVRERGFPGGGELLDRLAEFEVRPEDVDVLVHTHLHVDHCGWNSSGEGDDLAPVFPNATVVVSQPELDYWLDPAQEATPHAKAARRALLPAQVANRIRTFEGEHEVAPAVTAVPTPGHTPGHISLMLASQGEHLLITGDAAHHPVHLEHQEWVLGIDVDPAESARSRRKLSELAIERDALVTSGHFPILSLGRIRRIETGYRWEPATPRAE